MRKKVYLKVALALIICPLAMYAFSLTLPKRYTATMKLLVDQSFRFTGGRAETAVDDRLNFARSRGVQTQIDYITGADVLLRAVRKTAQDFPEAFADDLAASDLVNSMTNRLRVDVNKESEIIQLSTTMENPDIAAAAANNIGWAYIEETRKLASETGSSALMILTEDLEKDQARLEQIDNQIAKIKTDAGFTDALSTGTMGDRQVIDTESQLESLRAQARGANAEVAVAQASLASIPKYIRISTQTIANPEILSLDSQITRIDSELAAAKSKFTDDHPQVKQLSSTLAQLQKRRASIPAMIEQGVGEQLNPNWIGAQSQLNLAKQRADGLNGQVANLEGSLATMRSGMAKYPVVEEQIRKLERERQALEVTYNQNLTRKTALESQGTGRESQARIVSTALAPTTPSFPNTKLFVLMGLAIGIVISALIVMPKAPQVVYTPVPAETLSLNGHHGEPALPRKEEEEEDAPRPAIGTGSK